MAVLSKTYPLIESATDYWLGLLGAVLSCLHDHKLLRHRPDKYGLSRDLWSLQDLRGQIPLGAFAQIKDVMANWGFQYLLVDVLNDRDLPYSGWLKQGLSDIKGIDLTGADVQAYVSGTDAYSAWALAEAIDGRLLTDLRRSFANAHGQVRNTDLCLVLTGVRDYSVIALGEVEGVHGTRVRDPRFWASKSPATSFGIGVVEGLNGVELDVVDSSMGERFVMLFGADHGLARDFLGALDWTAYLLREGPHDRQRQRAEPGLREALAYIASRFSEPVSQLLRDLKNTFFFEEHSEVLVWASGGPAPSSVHSPSMLLLP